MARASQERRKQDENGYKVKIKDKQIVTLIGQIIQQETRKKMNQKIELDYDKRVVVLTSFKSSLILPTGLLREADAEASRKIPVALHDDIFAHGVNDQNESGKREYEIVIKVVFNDHSITVRNALGYAEEVARAYQNVYSKYEDLMRMLDLNRKYFER